MNFVSNRLKNRNQLLVVFVDGVQMGVMGLIFSIGMVLGGGAVFAAVYGLISMVR
jgi:hypothetical protein